MDHTRRSSGSIANLVSHGRGYNRILADRALLVSCFAAACVLALLITAAHDATIRAILAGSSLWWVVELLTIGLIVLVPVGFVAGVGDLLFVPVLSAEQQEIVDTLMRSSSPLTLGQIAAGQAKLGIDEVAGALRDLEFLGVVKTTELRRKPNGEHRFVLTGKSTLRRHAGGVR